MYLQALVSNAWWGFRGLVDMLFCRAFFRISWTLSSGRFLSSESPGLCHQVDSILETRLLAQNQSNIWPNFKINWAVQPSTNQEGRRPGFIAHYQYLHVRSSLLDCKLSKRSDLAYFSHFYTWNSAMYHNKLRVKHYQRNKQHSISVNRINS